MFAVFVECSLTDEKGSKYSMQASKVAKGGAKWNESLNFVVDHSIHKALLVEELIFNGENSATTLVGSVSLSLDTMNHATSDQWHTLNSQIKVKKGKKNVATNESIHLSTLLHAPAPVTTPRLAEALATRAMVTGPEMFCSEALPVTSRRIMPSVSAASRAVSRKAAGTGSIPSAR